jgi:hypothetical protein
MRIGHDVLPGSEIDEDIISTLSLSSSLRVKWEMNK